MKSFSPSEVVERMPVGDDTWLQADGPSLTPLLAFRDQVQAVHLLAARGIVEIIEEQRVTLAPNADYVGRIRFRRVK